MRVINKDGILSCETKSDKSTFLAIVEKCNSLKEISLEASANLTAFKEKVKSSLGMTYAIDITPQNKDGGGTGFR